MLIHRLYDLQQANALLPLINDVFATVRPMHEQLERCAAELVSLGQSLTLAADQPLPKAIIEGRALMHRMALQIHRNLSRITDLGVEVKSVEGLVDFRSGYHDRTVYLCWHWGEPEVHWFHELDGGFAGRRVIADPCAFAGADLN